MKYDISDFKQNHFHLSQSPDFEYLSRVEIHFLNRCVFVFLKATNTNYNTFLIN